MKTESFSNTTHPIVNLRASSDKKGNVVVEAIHSDGEKGILAEMKKGATSFTSEGLQDLNSYFLGIIIQNANSSDHQPSQENALPKKQSFWGRLCEQRRQYFASQRTVGPA